MHASATKGKHTSLQLKKKEDGRVKRTFGSSVCLYATTTLNTMRVQPVMSFFKAASPRTTTRMRARTFHSAAATDMAVRGRVAARFVNGGWHHV